MNIKQKIWGSRLGKLAVLGVAGLALSTGGAVAATVSGITYPLVKNSVAEKQVVDGSLQQKDFSTSVNDKLNKVGTAGPKGDKGDPGKDGVNGTNGMNGTDGAPGVDGKDGKDGAPGAKGDAGDPATDVKGSVVADKTFDPTPVAKIGGKFADNATNVGTVTIPKGKVKIDLDGFWTTLAAGPAGTRPQLALRAGAVNGGTIFPGEASPAKDRELTGHSTTVLTLSEDTTFTIYAFGYNDDTSANGAGRLAVIASVVAEAV